MTGIYEDAGEYNENRSYIRTPNGLYIWHSALHNWVITPNRGIIPDDYWKKAAGGIEGEYEPQGIVFGIATVAEI